MKTVWVVTTADGERKSFDDMQDAMAYGYSTQQSFDTAAEMIPDLLKTD